MSKHPIDEKAVFFAALGKATPPEREAYVRDACGDDIELLERVQKLLAAHNKSVGPFDVPPPGIDFSNTVDQPLAEKPGTLIGPYKLLQQIGEGGMGVVYMAEQTKPVTRRVALKIIKPGMDTRQVIARFEAERQALAMMDHPNVSKVLDAGTTDSGRPYFVMELVKGLPITQYCDQHKLNVRERLELFVPVCQAIQHAHQKGIIHRDIKPSNVMIARYDDQPVPKIIDFGVAKAVEHRLTEKTVFTQFGQIVGTFEYMSPEQAQLNQLDIDTRSDVYSLGVLLYELLTGETPFDGERLRSAAFDELLRIIREEDPPRPSLRLSTSDSSPENAANRQAEPKRLSTLVQGELDWIVMKALEKDRSRRYDTATALGADVEHYLNDEPVEACPPSSVYMLGKFTRRNKGWLSTAAAVLLTVLFGLSVSTILIAKERDAAEQSAARAEESAQREAIAAEEADRQRERAEANLRESRAAVDRLFTRAAEELHHVPHMSEIRRAMLEDAAEFYEGFVLQKSDDPEIRFEMGSAYSRLGYAYENLGRYEEMIPASLKAVAVFERLCKDYPDRISYQVHLRGSYQEAGVRLLFNGRPAEGLPYTLKALEIAKKLARQKPNKPHLLAEVARLHIYATQQIENNPDTRSEREAHFRKALALWKRLRADFSGFDDSEIGEAHALHQLGDYHFYVGQLEEAESSLRRSVALYKKAFEGGHKGPMLRGRYGDIVLSMGRLLLKKGQAFEAEKRYQTAIELLEPLVSVFPGMWDYTHRLFTSYSERVHALVAMGRFEEADQAHIQALEFARPFAEDHPNVHCNVALQHYKIGLMYHHLQDDQQAAASFQKAFADLERLQADLDPDVSIYAIANVSLCEKLVTCPLPQFRDAQRSIQISRDTLKLFPLSGDFWNFLGIGHCRVGSWDEAIEALGKSVELREGGDSSDFFFLAIAHWRRGDQDEARQWYQHGIQFDQDRKGALDLNAVNFRQEAEHLLGIAGEQPPSTSSVEEETKQEETEPTNEN